MSIIRKLLSTKLRPSARAIPRPWQVRPNFFFDTNYIRDIRDYINGENEPALKVMVFSEDHAILQQFIEHFDSHPELAVSSSGPDNLEITQRDATKGNALMAYAQSKGYQSDEILTIGDSHNDISMFHPVKYSYAMANASQLVKDQANYLAPSNKEDGVAQVIANLLKERH
ncbi:HAD hydrolase family protein [Aerococcus tenax]|uniref:HAD hydrolase family protein n=1 Tax=Aerococcus tenax TaxID=3078812 RepID=A0A5N1BSS1_9LACT|nr:HAD hydrolase family protein [Aerococcus urinae]